MPSNPDDLDSEDVIHILKNIAILKRAFTSSKLTNLINEFYECETSSINTLLLQMDQYVIPKIQEYDFVGQELDFWALTEYFDTACSYKALCTFISEYDYQSVSIFPQNEAIYKKWNELLEFEHMHLAQIKSSIGCNDNGQLFINQNRICLSLSNLFSQGHFVKSIIFLLEEICSEEMKNCFLECYSKVYSEISTADNIYVRHIQHIQKYPSLIEGILKFSWTQHTFFKLISQCFAQVIKFFDNIGGNGNCIIGKRFSSCNSDEIFVKFLNDEIVLLNNQNKDIIHSFKNDKCKVQLLKRIDDTVVFIKDQFVEERICFSGNQGSRLHYMYLSNSDKFKKCLVKYDVNSGITLKIAYFEGDKTSSNTIILPCVDLEKNASLFKHYDNILTYTCSFLDIQFFPKSSRYLSGTEGLYEDYISGNIDDCREEFFGALINMEYASMANCPLSVQIIFEMGYFLREFIAQKRKKATKNLLKAATNVFTHKSTNFAKADSIWTQTMQATQNINDEIPMKIVDKDIEDKKRIFNSPLRKLNN